MTACVARCRLLAVVLLLGASPPLAAQRPLHPEVAVGVALPTGPLGGRYHAGMLLRAGVLIVDSARVWRLRLDGEVLQLRARAQVAPSGVGPPTGVYRSVGSMATLVIGQARHVVAPYVVAGLGIQQVHVDGVTYKRNGVVPAGRVGGGLRANVGRYRISMELAVHLVFSGRGTAEEYRFWASYRPFTLGVSF